jgi:hypothetical protein
VWSFNTSIMEAENWTMLSDSCSDESVLARRDPRSSTVVGPRCAEAHDATKMNIARTVLDSTTRPPFTNSTGASTRLVHRLVGTDRLYQIPGRVAGYENTEQENDRPKIRPRLAWG